MKVFYGKSANSPDVPCEAPVDVSLETALEIFRGLIPKSGFMGVELDGRFVLQISARKRGVEVELLDTSIPAFDSCMADSQFAESLIRAAAAGQGVFQIARSSDYEWTHLDMSRTTQSN